MARRRLSTGGGRRMQAQWSNVIPTIRAVTIANASTLGATSVGASALDRLTLARIRGTAYCHMDAGAALDSMSVGLGLIVVKDEAFAVGGVASMPSPLSDVEQSWVWHHIFTMGPAVVAADDGADISRNSRIMIDSKAQRKLQIGETLAFVAEGEILAGTPTADLFARVRFMVLIP